MKKRAPPGARFRWWRTVLGAVAFGARGGGGHNSRPLHGGEPHGRTQGSARPGYRRLRRRTGDRGAGRRWRHGQGRPGPGHAGIGQGDDGSAGAVRRRGTRTQGQARRHLVGRQCRGAAGSRSQRGGRAAHPSKTLHNLREPNLRHRRNARARSKPARASNPSWSTRSRTTSRRHRSTRARRSPAPRQRHRRARVSMPIPYCRTRCPTPAPRCGCSRANSAWISRGSAARSVAAALPARTCSASSSARWRARRRAGRRGRGRRWLAPVAVAESRFRQVRRDRDARADAHPETLRRQPRAQLGDDPARHPARRCRHHRARSVAGRTQQGTRKATRTAPSSPCWRS